jgi:hypothetical protein
MLVVLAGLTNILELNRIIKVINEYKLSLCFFNILYHIVIMFFITSLSIIRDYLNR